MRDALEVNPRAAWAGALATADAAAANMILICTEREREGGEGVPTK